MRPERNRINKDHPNYYYRQHAQHRNMEVLPSTTGNDPVYEDHGLEASSHASSESADLKTGRGAAGGGEVYVDEVSAGASPEKRKKQLKRGQVNRTSLDEKAAMLQKQQDDLLKPPSAWNVYCAIVTFWAPGAIMRCFGKPQRAQQRAWREKVGLISIILLIAAFVGFLTFGFERAVCGNPTERIKANEVEPGYLIIHGRAFNLWNMTHPGVQERSRAGLHRRFGIGRLVGPWWLWEVE